MSTPCSFALSRESLHETVFLKQAVSLEGVGQACRSAAVLHSGVTLIHPSVCVYKGKCWTVKPLHVFFPQCLCAVLTCVRASTDPAVLKVFSLFNTAGTNRNY